MRFKEILTDDIQAMQEINRISQHIVNYFNQHPELVKSGVRVPLDKIIPNVLADKTLNTMRLAVEITIQPMADFKVVDGRWELRMAGGAFTPWWHDPVEPAGSKYSVVSPDSVEKHVRSDRYWEKQGTPQGKVGYEVGMGRKLPISLPAEVLTRSLVHKMPGDIDSTSKLQQIVQNHAKGILSTLSHEINHAYNALQGMDLDKTRKNVEKNVVISKKAGDWKMLLNNADDEAFLHKFQRMLTIPNTPTQVKEFWNISIEITNTRKNFRELERGQADWTEKVNNSTGEEAVKNKKILDDITRRLEGERLELQRLQTERKKLGATIKKFKVDPNLGTQYDGDVYFQAPAEINSRLQQASLDITHEIKPGMTHQAITDLIMKVFAENQITIEYIDPKRIKSMKAPPSVTDRTFKTWIQGSYLLSNDPANLSLKQEIFNSALNNPEFKRLVSIAYKYVQAEQANPSLLQTPPATRSQKLKAALLGIPQSDIGKTILPGAKDTATSAARRLQVATVQASKSLDTPAAIKAVGVAGKVLIPVGVVTEIYRGLDQISALPDNLPDAQRQQEIEKIIAKLVAEFGLVWVAAIVGAWMAGLALSAILPGLGTVAGAVVGFIAGGATGYFALNFAGDSVRSIAEKIVASRKNKASIPDYNPILERIVVLADIKKSQ